MTVSVAPVGPTVPTLLALPTVPAALEGLLV